VIPHYDGNIEGYILIGQAIPPISRAISFLALEFRALRVLRVLRALQVLRALPALPALPSPQLASSAVAIDCSPSTKMSQETLKPQIPLLISS
jgi:hypothetical protein